jgi:hypothetical protein
LGDAHALAGPMVRVSASSGPAGRQAGRDHTDHRPRGTEVTAPLPVRLIGHVTTVRIDTGARAQNREGARGGKGRFLQL